MQFIENVHIFKKIGACVFWAPYFSKSFGGKIKNFQTDVNKK